MEAFGKRQLCKKSVRRDSNGKPEAVVFQFRNGKHLECPLADLSADYIIEVAAHGVKQKVGDEGAKDKVTSADEFEAQARTMWQRLVDGTAFTRIAGVDTGGDLAVAMAEWKGKTLKEAQDFLKTCSAGERAKLRLHDEIKPILDRLARDKAKDVKGLDEKLAAWE